MWRFTHKIVDKFLKNTHLQEWPDWLHERVKEQSDLIRQWYSNEPIDKVKDWEIAQQWHDLTDPTQDWKWKPYGNEGVMHRMPQCRLRAGNKARRKPVLIVI